MKLDFVRISGFRGYRKLVQFDFSESFTIIDGRNGTGKSTVFDAVEFALTGTISKYLDAKASGESVEDYLWWNREGDTNVERFVEVGFSEKDEAFTIKRTPLDAESLDLFHETSMLFDRDIAPHNALAQLCTSTIIRDEHIARLSLDLKEVDRFTLLRDAIGAIDADHWIKRAQGIASTAQAKLKAAQAEVDEANSALSATVRQIDQAHSALPTSSLLNQATIRLQLALQTSAHTDRLVDIARQHHADMARDVDQLRLLMARYPEIANDRKALRETEVQLASHLVDRDAAKEAFDDAAVALRDSPASTELSQQARRLEQLVALGRMLGRRDGHCPLCETGITHEDFEHGLISAMAVARQLDANAVDQAVRERVHQDAKIKLEQTESLFRASEQQISSAQSRIAEYEGQLTEVGLAQASLEQIRQRIITLETTSQAVAADLRLLDSASFSRVILRAGEGQTTARERVTRAEARLGRARLADTRAKAIYDAVRRAAAETVDQRLDRVLPLMSELYRRLRPHPIWNDIEYSVRGDVKRFLKLQVGGNVNPQFVFSSGQRRATGLAFLLSVNLSIAWSRWRSILLDDPVQHVDDFRTVHLAEVLAHLCHSGRQIICAVEDSALADLMCRRLPTSELPRGKRISLGNDSEGDISITHQEKITPMSRRVLIAPDASLSA